MTAIPSQFGLKYLSFPANSVDCDGQGPIEQQDSGLLETSHELVHGRSQRRTKSGSLAEDPEQFCQTHFLSAQTERIYL